MSTVQEIQAAVPKLAPQELAELRDWLENFCEDQLELTDEVKARLDQSRVEIAAGQYRNAGCRCQQAPRNQTGQARAG
jgi:hypothetical protein